MDPHCVCHCCCNSYHYTLCAALLRKLRSSLIILTLFDSVVCPCVCVQMCLVKGRHGYKLHRYMYF